MHPFEASAAMTLPRKFALAIEKQRVETVYLVDAGIVELTQRAGRSTIVVGLRSAGAVIGACGALTDGRHDATVVALGDTRVRAVPIGAFHEARRSCPTTCEWVQVVLASEARDRTQWLIGLAARSAEDRLRALLADLFRRSSEMRADGSRRLTVPHTIEHLAAAVRVTRERASRVISDLMNAGIIARDSFGWFVAPAGSPLLRSLA